MCTLLTKTCKLSQLHCSQRVPNFVATIYAIVAWYLAICGDSVFTSFGMFAYKNMFHDTLGRQQYLLTSRMVDYGVIVLLSIIISLYQFPIVILCMLCYATLYRMLPVCLSALTKAVVVVVYLWSQTEDSRRTLKTSSSRQTQSRSQRPTWYRGMAYLKNAATRLWLTGSKLTLRKSLRCNPMVIH